MEPHPDFANTTFPREAELLGFRLTPLAPEVTVEDFEAVTASANVLRGLFGDDWPIGLTLEENRVDMGWHDREFTALRSFAWVIRTPDGAYLGCAYIYPSIGRRGMAQVITWIRDMPDRDRIAGEFDNQFALWTASYMPASVSLSWTRSPES